MAANTKARAILKIKKGIVPVSQATPYVKVLVYGRNGKGKTRFAASSSQGPTLILDINEEGTQSVRNYPDAFMYPIKSWADLTYAYWYLKEGDHPYKTVVIDTLTQAQGLCMKHVLKEQEDRDPNRPPSMPDRRSWGQMGELFKPVILNYRNLPMNVVFVCQERVDKSGDDDDDTTNRIVPDLSPSVRGVAMGAVGIMGRIYKKEVRTVNKKSKKEVSKWQTRMLVGPHEDFETKDRTGVLPHIVRNPTMDMMTQASLNSTEEDE